MLQPPKRPLFDLTKIITMSLCSKLDDLSLKVPSFDCQFAHKHTHLGIDLVRTFNFVL